MQCSNHPRLLKHLVLMLQCCQTATADESKMELVSLIQGLFSTPDQSPPGFSLNYGLAKTCQQSSISSPPGALPVLWSLPAIPFSLPPLTTASWVSRRIPEGGQRTRAGPVFHLPFLLLLDLVLATRDWRAVPMLTVTWLAWQQKSSREKEKRKKKSV